MSEANNHIVKQSSSPPPKKNGNSAAAVPDEVPKSMGNDHHPHDLSPRPVEWMRNPADGSVMLDHNQQPISVDRILATKPLKAELCTRPGPGGKKLTYLSGEGVSRTLNDIFGFDGWNLEIQRTQREGCEKDDKGRFHVTYTAQVRVTHRRSGAYKEDCGAGDAIDKQFANAIANALKASITDAMKRAARHFGDKLGNSLYQDSFSINKAPKSLKEAFEKHAVERANSKFGFRGDHLPQIGQRDVPAPQKPQDERKPSPPNSVPCSNRSSQQEPMRDPAPPTKAPDTSDGISGPASLPRRPQAPAITPTAGPTNGACLHRPPPNMDGRVGNPRPHLFNTAPRHGAGGPVLSPQPHAHSGPPAARAPIPPPPTAAEMLQSSNLFGSGLMDLERPSTSAGRKSDPLPQSNKRFPSQPSQKSEASNGKKQKINPYLSG